METEVDSNDRGRPVDQHDRLARSSKMRLSILITSEYKLIYIWIILPKALFGTLPDNYLQQNSAICLLYLYLILSMMAATLRARDFSQRDAE